MRHEYIKAMKRRSSVLLTSTVAYVAVILSLALPQTVALLAAAVTWLSVLAWWFVSYTRWQMRETRQAVSFIEHGHHLPQMVAEPIAADQMMPRVHDELTVDVSQGSTLQFRRLNTKAERIRAKQGPDLRPRCCRCGNRWLPDEGVDAQVTPCYACMTPHPLEIVAFKGGGRRSTPGGEHGESEQKYGRHRDRDRGYSD